MWKKSKHYINISWNWEVLVGKIGENMWWVDQKIVNGDKQKNETQSEFSCIFKVFVAIPRDIVNYTTIYILTSKSSLWNFSIKAPSVGWEKNYSGNMA